MSPSQIQNFAAQHGVEFSAEKAQGEWSVDCYAPERKRWRAHGTHFLSLPADGFYGTPNWQDSLSILKEEVAYGFEDCDEPECDICHPA